VVFVLFVNKIYLSFIVSFRIPGFRDSVMPQIRGKVTAFFAYMQIFLHFFCIFQLFFVPLHSILKSTPITPVYVPHMAKTRQRHANDTQSDRGYYGVNYKKTPQKPTTIWAE